MREPLSRAGWYVSYMHGEQGKALILCQEKRIKQLVAVIEAIKGETEQLEYDADFLLHSINDLIDNIEPVEHTVGYYTWTTEEGK